MPSDSIRRPRVRPAGESRLRLHGGRLGERFGYDDLDIAMVDFEGERVPVATPRTLYEMKRDTPRALDKADAAVLRRTFDFQDD